MAGPEELCWRSKPLAASSGNRLLVQAVMDTCPQLTMRSIRLQKSTVHPFGFSGPLNGGDRPVCDYSCPYQHRCSGHRLNYLWLCFQVLSAACDIASLGTVCHFPASGSPGHLQILNTTNK